MVFASPRPAAAFSSTLEDTIADYLALFIMIVAPILLITVILAIHVIPEKVAYRRHHPQADAIKVLCFLSLVFGGLLWPLAWLWAYSKPVLYKMAYGEDKVIHSHGKGDENETKPQAVREEVARLRQDVAALDGESPSIEAVGKIRAELAVLEATLASPDEVWKESA